MLTQDQINASIDALRPAPAEESLLQVTVRAVHWLLGTIEDEHRAIADTRALCGRIISGDEPTDDAWRANIVALDRALDLARFLALDLALDLARVLARFRDRDLAIAIALARALDLALDLDLALARATARLLGDRLVPIPLLYAEILGRIDAGSGALDMGVYHRCETTHCLAGWANTLHPLGAALEHALGPWLAGAVIFLRSTGAVPDFFASNEDAMASMRAAAREELLDINQGATHD